MQPLIRLLALILFFLITGMAGAQDYPAKPVRLLVPFQPGGLADLVARTIAPKLGELLGQQVIVDYKSGAGGSIGAADAARAAPDGHTLLIIWDTHAINHHVYKVQYDFHKSFDPISMLVQAPGILVASPGFAPSTIRELIAYANANPEKVTYGSSGIGSSNHLAGLMFNQMTGVKMTHVPYKGGGSLSTDLLGGHVNIVFGPIAFWEQHVRSGKLKAIAVSSKARIAKFPDVPTVSESVPGFEAKTWFGLLAPAGTPKEILARVHHELLKTLADAKVREQLTSRGFDVVPSTPEAFGEFLRQESDIAGRLVRESGLKAE